MGNGGIAMKLIERTYYLDKLKDVMGTPDIKVITGVRRSGKSKLLEAFMDHIRQSDGAANIIHINYSLSEYEPLLEYHKLNEYVEQEYRERRSDGMISRGKGVLPPMINIICAIILSNTPV